MSSVLANQDLSTRNAAEKRTNVGSKEKAIVIAFICVKYVSGEYFIIERKKERIWTN